MTNLIREEKEVTTRTMAKTGPPQWLLAFWKEIDDKTFGMFPLETEGNEEYGLAHCDF